MTEKDNKSFWSIITAPVLYHKELSDKSKILFGVISNLTKQKGYCYAHNSTLAEELGWGERTVQDCIKQLETAGFVKRISELVEKNVSVRKIYIITHPQNSAGDPGSTLLGAPAAACTHNEVINEVNKLINYAPKKRSPKKIDPQHKQAQVEHEIGSLTRWQELTQLWFTGENPHGLKGTFKKYFLPLSQQEQEQILNMVKSFGEDSVHLFNIWIGQTFKENKMNEEFLKESIQRQKEIAKRKNSSQTGKYKKPSFFGNE